MFANRSLTADLLVPDLVGRCKANPLVTVDAEDVDLSKACASSMDGIADSISQVAGPRSFANGLDTTPTRGVAS